MQFIKAQDYMDLALCFLEGKDREGKPHPKDLTKAENILHEILNHNAGNPVVLYALGSLYLSKHHTGLAIQILSQVAAMAPEFGEAWNNLGLAWKDYPDFDKAEVALRNAVKFLKPQVLPDIYANLSAININRHRPEECLKWAEQALALAPYHPQALWHKGLALLEQGNWSGWELHEYRLKGGAPGEIAERNYHGSSKTPEWDGKTKGTLVIHGEQGMGDEIMFSSCLPDAIATGCRIIFEPSPRLEPVFKTSFPSLEVFGTNDTDGRRWIGELGRPDFKIALGSLPKFFRLTDSSFPGTPFLRAPPEKTAWWGDKLRALPQRPNIGIAWQGGVQKTRYDARSFHPRLFKPLFNSIDANWISLQYDSTARYCAEEVKTELGVKLHHWPKAVEQLNPDTGKHAHLDELFGLVSGLDLVITVPQTAYHVAGSLGVPCFVLTQHEIDWRLLASTRTSNPWYNSIQLIRQKTPGGWKQVIEEAILKTKAFLNHERKKCAS